MEKRRATEKPKLKPSKPVSAQLEPPHPADAQVPRPNGLPLRKVIFYCSDCSGLDGAAFALKRLRSKVVHLFGSEIDPKYMKVFKTLHPDCREVFSDMTKREHWMIRSQLPPPQHAAVVYCAGFPCQPYSRQGKRGGSNDERSEVIWHIVDTLETLLPDLFILEQVPDLVGAEVFRDQALKILLALLKLGKTAYYIDFRVLDNYDIGQVPAAVKEFTLWESARIDSLQSGPGLRLFRP